jgi:hypothetical protein
MNSALYLGRMMHRRLRPRRHHLAYRLFTILLDLDELPGLSSGFRWFSHNRWNLFSFHDADYGDGSGPLRPQVEAHLAKAGIDIAGGPIRLLTLPRILGHVFNPLSVYFCSTRDGALRAVLYEVTNTFGQRHSYLAPVGPQEEVPIRQRCDKNFYVSPFMPMDLQYEFRVRPPDETVLVNISVLDSAGPLLHAALTGRRCPLTDTALLRSFFAYPLLTLKVIGAIHWEALKLFLKGVPLVPRPAPPTRPVTHVPPVLAP